MVGRQLRSMIVFVGIAAPLISSQNAAAQAMCTGSFSGQFRITAGIANTDLPPKTTQLTIINADNTTSPVKLTPPTDNTWTPTLDDVAHLTQAQVAKAKLLFSSGPQTGCLRTFSVISDSGATVSDATPSKNVEGALTERTFNQDECRKAGATWEHDLRSQRGHAAGHFTELVFLESLSGNDANVCFYNRDYGVVGDPIYVAVFKQKGTWEAVRFEPCAAQSAAPNILQSSEKFPSTLQKGAWQIQTFLPRRCYNVAVDVSIVGRSAEGTLVQRYPLTQYDRYRGTVQAGILYTALHDATFALRRDQSDTSKSFIYEKGPSNKGPEYVATLNLYSILKYLPSLFSRNSAEDNTYYAGRDPIHDQHLFDRIGAVLGVGITNPTRRFAAGGSFELIYGVSAIWVADFARVNALAPETSTTIPFKGLEADIPTIVVWRRTSSVGLSLDLRYVSSLLTGNRQ